MAAPKPRRLVGISLKMYFDLHATREYLTGVASLAKHADSYKVGLFVIPDFLSITSGAQILQGTSILLGAQDTFWEDSGAFTGEVSPRSLAQAGVKIVEIGHAERRRLFGETNDHIAKKAAAAVRNGIVPLICVGEESHSPIASAAVGLAVEECRMQVVSAIKGLPDEAEVIVAYEPVWAIGATEPASPDHVVAVVRELRRMVQDRKGTTRILYGGSAGPGTFAELAEAVDGLFLCRFGHDLGNLENVIEEVGQSKTSLKR